MSGHQETGPGSPEQPAAVRNVGRLGELLPVIVLACTTCQWVYRPDLADFGNGNTGCPRCHGWTWIAQLGGADGGR